MVRLYPSKSPTTARPRPAAASGPFRLTGSPTTVDIVRSRVRRRLARTGVSCADRDDLSQELFLRLLRVEWRFDPRVAPAEAFIAVVVDRDIADLVRKRRRGRLPLDLSVNLNELADPRDGPAAVNLAFDVATVLAGLPEPLRTTADQLKRASKAEAARNLGVSRQTLNTRVRDLRAAFERYQLRHR